MLLILLLVELVAAANVYQSLSVILTLLRMYPGTSATPAHKTRRSVLQNSREIADRGLQAVIQARMIHGTLSLARQL
jgi:hypothetical protein